jgi:hypothetical protein
LVLRCNSVEYLVEMTSEIVPAGGVLPIAHTTYVNLGIITVA